MPTLYFLFIVNRDRIENHQHTARADIDMVCTHSLHQVIVKLLHVDFSNWKFSSIDDNAKNENLFAEHFVRFKLRG